MKNKILFVPTFLLIAISGLLVSCNQNEFKEVNITAVKELYLPESDKGVSLINSQTASVYFEWEKAEAEDSGVLYYDVLFDKENGDFSNPIYVVVADNRGISTGATITHRVLNRIAGFAGIEPGETGAIKWTIRASRGLTNKISDQHRKLYITRLNGYEAPPALYLTGEGSEGGSDYEKAVSFKALTNDKNELTDEFEIFTKLTAGQEFKFVDNKTEAAANIYYSEGDQLKQGKSGSNTVESTGVYRIWIDFPSGICNVEKVEKVDFYMCTPKQRIAMTYQNNGTWKAENIKPDFHTNWNDDRYFYFMTINGKEYKVASGKKDNQAPGGLNGEYFNIGYFGDDANQWDYSFKFPEEMRNAAQGTVIVDMILYLNATKYTNEIIKKY